MNLFWRVVAICCLFCNVAAFVPTTVITRPDGMPPTSLGSKSAASTTMPRSTVPCLHTRGEFREPRNGVSALNALESASSDESGASGVDYAAIAK